MKPTTTSPTLVGLLTQRAARYRGGFPDGDVHLLLDERDELTLSFTGDRARLAYGHTPVEPRLALEATTAALLELLRNAPDDSDPLDDDVSVAGQTELLRPLLRSLIP